MKRPPFLLRSSLRGDYSESFQSYRSDSESHTVTVNSPGIRSALIKLSHEAVPLTGSLPPWPFVKGGADKSRRKSAPLFVCRH